MMKTIKSISAMRRYTMHLKKSGCSIGLVPTMGALHDGHCALIRAAKKNHNIVIVTIFVNSKQFNSRGDLKSYPRSLRTDRRLCGHEAVDILFLPNEKSVYPLGFQTEVFVKNLSKVYEGAARPGHFKGVTTVLAKLCHIVSPDQLYLGQKDYQQAIVVKQMLSDLNLPISLSIQSTIRESDGLAMSSRNLLLKPTDRKSASVLYRALQEGKNKIRLGERSGYKIRRSILAVLRTEPSVEIDYIAAMHPYTLEDMKLLSKKVVLAIAVHIGNVRLIDNIIVRIDK